MLIQLLALATAADGIGSSGKCVGTIVPPVGYMVETAFVPNSNKNAAAEASEHAREQLLDRLCTAECQDLRAEISIYKVLPDADVTCAMAVIEERTFKLWKKQSSFDLEGQHDAVVAELFADVRRPDGGTLNVTVVIDKVFDEDSNGGPRSVWLVQAMAGALSRADFNRVDPPANWAGDGVPKPVDALLGARLLAVPGDRNMLDLTWSVRFTEKLKARNRTSRVMHIPEARAPERTPSADRDFGASGNPKSLFVRLDTASGGVLCNGQKTQLTVHSDANRCVKVFDIYGDSVLLIFPNAERKSCTVLAGETLPIGNPEGFAVLLDSSTDVERFLAIGAKNADEFPRELKVMTTSCKLSRKRLEGILKRAKGLTVREESVRILREDARACAKAEKVSVAEAAEAAESLKGYPECP